MRTEHELQQDIENYESFFNTIDDFLFILDERGNILLTNSTVTGRLGYRSEELAGKSVLLVHPESRRAEAGRIVAEMLEGTAQMCPVPLITKSGVQIPVETRITRGIWNGKPALFGVTKDISRVQLSEEKFSKLFHLNPSACGLSSLDDNTYIEVNDAFVSLFGYTREKAEQLVEDMVKRGEVHRKDAQGMVGEIVQKGEAQRGELEKMITAEVEKALGKTADILHFARKEDVTSADELRRIIREEIAAALPPKE